jgi:hypothetical protein
VPEEEAVRPTPVTSPNTCGSPRPFQASRKPKYQLLEIAEIDTYRYIAVGPLKSRESARRFKRLYFIFKQQWISWGKSVFGGHRA